MEDLLIMLIPMFSFRDKAEKLYTIPLPFMGTRDADSRLKEIYGNPDDIFYQAVIVAEFNPKLARFSLLVRMSRMSLILM